MSVSSYLRKLFGAGPKSNLPIADVDKRFELLGRTGQGSMSKVYRARDRDTGRTICLKILDKEKTAKFEARFVGMNRPLEGFISTALRHKNIVQTFEYGLTKKREQYLIMELIEGMGLNFLIATKSSDLNRKRVDVLTQLADGLAYVHEQKYLHRDICPRNVMVTKEGQVKLIDFGLTIPYLPAYCKPGNRTGTPNYLAPELIKRITTDHRVDLFALGVTAYETFTGEMPWEKTQSLATLQSHLNSPGKDPREFVPDMIPELAQILMKSIDRTPSQRYQSAIAFRDALKALPPMD
ncbi:serine/threonine-protein kinase [soil metagenome]